MLQMNADAAERKKTISQIVCGIDRQADPNAGYGRQIGKLKKTEPPLVRRAGRSGFYLTAAGLAVAKRLNAP